MKIKVTALSLRRLLAITDPVRNCCADPVLRPRNPRLSIVKLMRGHKALLDQSVLNDVLKLLEDIGPVDVNLNDDGLKETYYLCSYCHTHRPKLNTCSRCKKAFYCNRDCQKAHWKYHKVTCTKSAPAQGS